ncbi:MAG TPA: (4Fe-4S)-binding protein [Lachnospiraceae bacterium]|nr:(4Fe-4S)-binding protein [Lachnospiraceae bacterium]
MSALTVSAADEKRVKGMGFLNNKGTDNFNGRIITVNGKITAAQQRCIAEAAEKFGSGEVVFTTRLTVEVPGIPYDKIEEFQAFIAKEGLVTGGTGSKVRPVVSCKGTTCQYGLLDSYAISEEIHKRFYEGYRKVLLPHKFKIAVGGCPNNCVKPDLNDLGIVGQRIPEFDEDSCNGCKKCAIEKLCPTKAAKVVDGVLEIDKDVCNNCGRCVEKCPFDAIADGTYGFKIYIGGRWGKSVAHGRALRKVFTDKEEALSVIEKAILLFREQGKTGERFAQTIDRLGFENVEAQLLSDDILSRKDEILAAELHLKGGATC